MYALTQRIGAPDQRAIVGPGGRLDFPAEDGPILADMLDREFPACEECEDREGVCEDCGACEDCDGGCGCHPRDDWDDADDEDDEG